MKRSIAVLGAASLAVGLVSASIIFRFVRSSVLEALNQDYTRMARAKGFLMVSASPLTRSS